MKEVEIMQKIGLTDNEIKIYLSLLKIGSSLASKIVDETKLNRTYIYDRLDKLLDKGLVSYVIKSGKKYFNAVPPDKLLYILEKKEFEIKDEKRQLKKILPDLLSLAKKTEDISIEVFKGMGGLKSITEDILREKKDLFVIGFTGALARELKYFYPQFQKRRVELGIKRKILADHNMRKSPLLEKPLTECRFIPETYQSPSGMWVYGDKTTIFLPEKEIYCILIRSKKVAQLYKNYFDILWKIARL